MKYGKNGWKRSYKLKYYMKKMLVLATSAMMLVACSEKPGYEITGTVNNPALEGKCVYLQSWS